jgi:hypothetical protein
MAAYPKPSNNTGTFNNQNFVHPDTGGLTIDEAKAYFVTYPNTQSPSTITANNFSTTGSLNVGGTSQFGGDATFIGGATITGPLIFSDNVEVDGTTTLNDTLLALSTAEIDGELTVNNNIILNVDPAFPGVKTFIQFSDLTVQDTAFVDANYAQKNESNTFISPYIQTFQGSNATGPTTAPLQFSNATTSEYGTLYVDPGVNNDLTIYSNQVGGGLTVRNSTNSFTINPTTTNTATFLNPIATNSSITGSVFNVVAPNQDAYSLYLNSVGGYGLVVANITTGGLGTLTLSNNGSTNTTLTSTASGLSINDTVFATQFNISNGSYFPSGINSGINNNSSNNAGQNPFFYFALNDTTNTQQIPFYLYYNALLLNATLNMNNNDINNVKNVTGNSTSNITFNSSIGMGTGKNIIMNNNSISLISSLSGGSGATPITISSPLTMSPASNIAMNNNNITLIGSGSTAFTQPNGTSGTSIATTAYVQNMYVTQTISLAANNLYYEVVPGFNSFISSYIQLDNNQYIVTLNTLLTTSNPMLFDTNTAMPPNTVNTLTFTFNGGVTVPYAPSTGTNLGKIVLQNTDTLTQQNVRITMFNNAVILTLQNTLYLSPNTSYQLYFIKNNITVG